MTTVLHLKLTTGEEIIGKFVGLSEDEDSIILEKTRTLAVQPLGQGQMGIGMIPFMVGNPDGEVRIARDKILGEPVDGPPKNLEDSYLQQVSGLTFATSAANAGKIEI